MPLNNSNGETEGADDVEGEVPVQMANKSHASFQATCPEVGSGGLGSGSSS